MVAAANLALTTTRLDSVTAGRMTDAVLALGSLPKVDVRSRNILKRLQSDKKTKNGVVHFVLPREIGKVEIVDDVPERAVIIRSRRTASRFRRPLGSANASDSLQLRRRRFDQVLGRWCCPGRRNRPAIRVASRARDVHHHRAALRPAQSCSIVQHRSFVVAARAARTFDAILKKPGAKVLDLCCGTGDMTFALCAAPNPADLNQTRPEITGADFSHTMLQRAVLKGQATPLRWVEADALSLPLPNEHFDLVTSAFGFRNLADYDAGLREIVRVLRPGGECGILDFGEPKGLMGTMYRIYFKKVLPRIGTLISGVKGPYAYLPASVERFPEPAQMLDRMRSAGFREATWTPYTFGIAGLYRGRK